MTFWETIASYQDVDPYAVYRNNRVVQAEFSASHTRHRRISW